MNFVGKHGISSKKSEFLFLNKSICTHFKQRILRKKIRETTFLGYKTTSFLSQEIFKNIFQNLKMKICLKINNRRKVSSFLVPDDQREISKNRMVNPGEPRLGPLTSSPLNSPKRCHWPTSAQWGCDTGGRGPLNCRLAGGQQALGVVQCRRYFLSSLHFGLKCEMLSFDSILAGKKRRGLIALTRLAHGPEVHMGGNTAKHRFSHHYKSKENIKVNKEKRLF